jgi:hypothetical protein
MNIETNKEILSQSQPQLESQTSQSTCSLKRVPSIFSLSPVKPSLKHCESTYGKSSSTLQKRSLHPVSNNPINSKRTKKASSLPIDGIFSNLCFYFVPGTDLTNGRIQIFKDAIEKKGGKVVAHLSKHVTHIIVSSDVISMEKIPLKQKYRNVNKYIYIEHEHE